MFEDEDVFASDGLFVARVGFEDGVEIGAVVMISERNANGRDGVDGLQ